MAVTNLLNGFKNGVLDILIIIMAFLTPIKPLILIVGCAIFLDTFFGIWKSKKAEGWSSVTSYGLRSIVGKMITYQTALILMFAMETYALGEIIQLFIAIPLFLTKIVALVLVSIEARSIDENYKAISGISLFEAFKKLLKFGKEMQKESKNFKK